MGYDRLMPIGEHIQAWRRHQGLSAAALADRSGLSVDLLDAIEEGTMDPPASIVEALAAGLQIPLGWVYDHPALFQLLLSDPDEDENSWQTGEVPDPVTQHILRCQRHHRELYALVTALLQAGDPKLLRAMEVNLRSLIKQAKTATVPWQSRPPGHFEPPSD